MTGLNASCKLPNACRKAAHWEFGSGRLGAAPLASVLSSKPCETVSGLSLGSAVNVCATHSLLRASQEHVLGSATGAHRPLKDLTVQRSCPEAVALIDGIKAV